MKELHDKLFKPTDKFISDSSMGSPILALKWNFDKKRKFGSQLDSIPTEVDEYLKIFNVIFFLIFM